VNPQSFRLQQIVKDPANSTVDSSKYSISSRPFKKNKLVASSCLHYKYVGQIKVPQSTMKLSVSTFELEYSRMQPKDLSDSETGYSFDPELNVLFYKFRM